VTGADWWGRVAAGFTGAVPPDVPLWELLAVLAVAVGLSVPALTWRYFGLFTTVVHELGHAFGNLMTGRLVTGITVKMDHSGSTTSYGRGILGLVWSGFWGYPAPAVTGAALVWAGFAGYGPAAMSVGVIILLATILFIRNGIGLLIVLGSALVAGTLVMFVPAAFTGHVVIALGLALLVGSVRAWVNLVVLHFRRRELLETSDAYLLFRRTMIPSPVWLLLFGAVIGFAWISAYGSFGHLITRAFG
jgi:hypothetical protein